MLYITLKGSRKYLYINITAISKYILVAALVIMFLYVSNQEYLSYIN